MLEFAPAPIIENKAAQQAAFIALLAEYEGLIGKQWNNRTSEIAGFAHALSDEEYEYDAETRREFSKVIGIAAHDLRRQHDELKLAAMFLSGTPIPLYSQAIDLRLLLRGDARLTEVRWNAPTSVVNVSEDHAEIMLTALTHLAQHLANGGFQISVENKAQNIQFIFSGDVKPAYFTDPSQWFTIDEKQGDDSIGLFVARELAQMYGGRVWVETANKTRFDFRLSLPVTQESVNE